MRKTTSGPREPHTDSRPDFAEVHLFCASFLNCTLSGPPVSTESTFSRPFQETRRYTFSSPLPVINGGLEKVLSVSTGGPDKVRFKKNSQIRYTWAKSGLETACGSRRREVVFRMAISPGKHVFFPVFFEARLPRAPPALWGKNLGKKKRSGWCLLLFSRFWSFFVPFLGKKREGIPFLGLCPWKIVTFVWFTFNIYCEKNMLRVVSA